MNEKLIMLAFALAAFGLAIYTLCQMNFPTALMCIAIYPGIPVCKGIYNARHD